MALLHPFMARMQCMEPRSTPQQTRTPRRRFSSVPPPVSVSLFADLNNNELPVPVINQSRKRYVMSAIIYRKPSIETTTADGEDRESHLAVHVFGSSMRVRSERTIPDTVEQFLTTSGTNWDADCEDHIVVSAAYCVPRMEPVSYVTSAHLCYDTTNGEASIVYRSTVELRRRYYPVAAQSNDNKQHEVERPPPIFVSRASWTISDKEFVVRDPSEDTMRLWRLSF
ncbi:uncharacterized protein LOC131209164 [Anopheles bellator]|uniref:uncharacterized protein LOC131209164 n=1 Tax=Anopheles bellator TaxID=139047 RepID=UPI0026493B7F|nr:uncharacterized protein LOC131209164 [Anopheles bellator]